MLAIRNESGEEVSTGIDCNSHLADQETPVDFLRESIFGEIFPKDVAFHILGFRCSEEFLGLNGEVLRYKLYNSGILIDAQSKRANHVSECVRYARSRGQRFPQGRTCWSTPEEDAARDLLLVEMRKKENIGFLFCVHFPHEFRLDGSL